jgi:hypothetical protein
VPVERPEKITSHDVGNNGKQHQKNRDPKNPAMVHSTPVRNTMPMMFMTMLSLVHMKQPDERYYRHRRNWKRKKSPPLVLSLSVGRWTLGVGR